MTKTVDYAYLDLPISERIERYENEFRFGVPTLRELPNGSFLGRSYRQGELESYVLYRLKREEYERADIARRNTGE